MNGTLRIGAFLLLYSPVLAADQPGGTVLWQHTDRERKIVDVLPLKDGSTCVLFENASPILVSKDLSKTRSLDLPREKCAGLSRVFPDKKHESGLIVTGKTGNGPCVLSYRDGKWTDIALIKDHLDNMRCYQSRDGTIWLHSWEGVIYSVADGKVEKRDLAERVDTSAKCYTYYQPLEVAESPGGALCFFQQFGHQNSGRSIEHLLVCSGGAWQKITCAALHPGGAFFSSETNLVVATENGLTEYDLSQGGKEIRITPLPGDGPPLQRPIFLKKLADGTLAGLWGIKGRDGGWTGIPAYEDGSFSRIVEFKDNAWRIMTNSVDASAWDTYQLIRPAAFDEEGGLWLASAGGGLLYRSPNGTWQKLDWQKGVNSGCPVRLAAGAGRLWIVDRDGFCATLDSAKLLQSAPQATPWSIETLRTALRRKTDGSLYGISDKNGGCVVTFGAKGKNFGAALPRDKFRIESIFYMTLDSENGIWIFGDITQGVVAHFDGKEWRTYAADGKRGLPFHAKEIAFEAQLAKGEKYRIGTPEDCYYPIFTGDGRILYKNEWSRACYFDGTTWHAPYGDYEVGSSTLSAHPFFHDGKVTVHVGEKSYQMENDAWTKVADDREQRPWKEVGFIPHPFRPAQEHTTDVVVPEECPIASADVAWKLESDGWIWVGGANRIACSPGKGWITTSTDFSPLAWTKQVTAVHPGPCGEWFFDITVSGAHRYAVYRGKQLDANARTADLGAVDHPFSVLTPDWRIDGKPDELLMRHRVDDDAWSGLSAPAAIDVGIVQTRGRHRLQVEFFGRNELLCSRPLDFFFEVKYDMHKLMSDVVAKLGANSFTERAQATKDLIRFGKDAIPYLKQAKDHEDPEVRARVREILDAVRTGGGRRVGAASRE